MTPQRNATPCRFLVSLAAVAIWISGCSPPQASPQNLQLIASLRTALSTKNSEWLEENARIVEQRRAAGEGTAEEFARFQAIIDKARGGQWQEAEADVIAFQKAQRPTGR